MTLTKVSYSMVVGSPANIIDYGADPTGLSDSTSAIQEAINTGNSVYFPDGIYTISGALTLSTNNQIVFGNGVSSYINQTSTDVGTFLASSLSGICIKDVKITPAPGHAVASTSAIKLDDCSDCYIENVTVDFNNNSAFHGVWLVNSNNCLITNNLFINAPDTNNAYFTYGGADISLTELCNKNIIQGNRCISGNVYGINQTTNTNGSALGNVITDNIIENCTAYGIILYGGTANRYIGSAIISNNVIKNITGGALAVVSPAEKWFGAGIYLNGALNCTVSNNVVEDTCLQTNAGSLPIGAICGTQNANTIVGNTIRNSGKLGIYFSAGNASSTFPEPLNVSAIVANNIVSGTDDVGIKMYNGRRVTIEGNALYSIGSSGIIVDTNGDWTTESRIYGNSIYNATSGIVINNQSNTIICQNSINSISSGGIGIGNTSYAIINENTLESIGINGISIGNTVTSGTVSNNALNNIGNVALIISANMRSTNNVFGTVGTVYSGTYSPYQSSAPAAGTWVVNNTVLNSSPAAGQPQGWVCTVSGTPGTWKAMANLA